MVRWYRRVHGVGRPMDENDAFMHRERRRRETKEEGWKWCDAKRARVRMLDEEGRGMSRHPERAMLTEEEDERR
jgi:hypothetical protein